MWWTDKEARQVKRLVVSPRLLLVHLAFPFLWQVVVITFFTADLHTSAACLNIPRKELQKVATFTVMNFFHNFIFISLISLTSSSHGRTPLSPKIFLERGGVSVISGKWGKWGKWDFQIFRGGEVKSHFGEMKEMREMDFTHLPEQAAGREPTELFRHT